MGITTIMKSNVMRKFIKLSLSVGALLLAVMSNAIQAAPITVTVSTMAFANPTTVNLSSQIPSVHVYAYAGAFSTTSSDDLESFLSWCIDIFQHTLLNQPVTDYAHKTATEVLGVGKTDLLLRLATESLGLVVDSRTSSAFQLAMWEIVNEEVNTPFNFSAGNFKAWNASDDSLTLAMSWLSNLPDASVKKKYALSVLASDSRQDLATFTPSQVPEPASLSLLERFSQW